jgi:hypothetical protein
MDALIVALPQLLFGSLSALPLAIGIIAAIRQLREGSRAGFVQHLCASTAGGAVALALLWSSLFGDSLSKSSTAGLIFAVAPVYAAVAQGVVHAILGWLFKKAASPRTVSPFAWPALLLPLLMLAVLMFGLVKTSTQGNESGIAQRSSDQATLQRLLEQSRTGAVDAFAVPFNLAQNHNASPEMLVELAKHDNPSVRGQVARNPRTPQATVVALRNDCAKFVRNIAEERLGPNVAAEPASERSGVCVDERLR